MSDVAGRWAKFNIYKHGRFLLLTFSFSLNDRWELRGYLLMYYVRIIVEKTGKAALFHWPGMGLQDFPNTWNNREKSGSNDTKRRVRLDWLCPTSKTHLCGIVNILKGRVTGHHGSQIWQGTHRIEPALCVIWFGALKELNHCKERWR